MKTGWLNGHFTGVTAYTGYEYLTTLLKIQEDERLYTVVEAFLAYAKKKGIERQALVHLEEIGVVTN